MESTKLPNYGRRCAPGTSVSDDKLTWTFTLRDGLMFHDGEKVLAKDCVMSLRRWGSRDLFGQVLMAATNDVVTTSAQGSTARCLKACSGTTSAFA